MQYQTLDAETVRSWLPRRKRDAHKGDFGRVLLICGAEGYTGAPALAAMAAARSGAGLVFVCVPSSVYPIVASHLLEPMVFPMPEEHGQLSGQAVAPLLERLRGCDACLIGCGLGRSEGVFQVVRAVLQRAQCPVVVDADGINVLAGHMDILRGAACPVILTPHEGEALRLAPESRGMTREDRLALLHQLTGATVLLKGENTLIYDGTDCFRNPTGNPGLATGGSGDVLSGIIVSLLGQGLPPVRAAAAGAWLHGRAADLCAEAAGEYGLLPSDLFGMLPRLLP